MSQLPYRSRPAPIGNPTDDSGPAPAGAGQPLTVSQAAALIKQALADAIPARVRVAGEVSNFTDRTHWFFSIKDEQSVLRCVCFASAARKVTFGVRDGLQIVATGRIDFYDVQGHVQLYVDQIEPVGQGSLELRLRQLMDQLRRQGYFDADRKKALPVLPRRVAVVTSRSAAALQDVIHTAGRRWPGCRLYLFDVRVQGETAAPQIAAALRTLSESGPRMGLEAIILTRGGGSIEDLWAFNERVVADAIDQCLLPVVAAIGHETDTTIAELVADVRCATPTQAAMTLIPDREALEHQVHQIGRRLSMQLGRQAEHARQRLTAAARHTLFRNPRRMVDLARKRVDAAAKRLGAAPPRDLRNRKARINALARQLGAVGPNEVLKRGYSYTLGPDGSVLRRAADTAAGDQLTTVLSEGRLRSRVEGGAAGESGSSPAQPRTQRAQDDKPGLFGHQ